MNNLSCGLSEKVLVVRDERTVLAVADKFSSQVRVSRSKVIRGLVKKRMSQSLASFLMSWTLKLSPPDRLESCC